MLGAGLLVLGLAVWAARPATGWSRMVPLAVIAAGCGMVVSGLYPTDPAGAPTTTERVHSLASGSATLALIGAAVVVLAPRDRLRPRRAIGPAGVLAGAALALGAVSPVLHETVWTGLSQRLLWLTLMGWLLVTAWQLARPSTPHRQRVLRAAHVPGELGPPVEVTELTPKGASTTARAMTTIPRAGSARASRRLMQRCRSRHTRLEKPTTPPGSRGRADPGSCCSCARSAAS